VHLIKGAIINFSTRTIGMFEVVEPILEGDEVFDSSLLKQMVESMIASGKRNICVDLASQEYLYSDAINALVGINKRMLDVMGRLSLVAPQPPVVEILKKGGIANILKIFENDDELMKVSQQLMGGAPPVVNAPVAPPPLQQEPQSEFDELRSEIGSVFGNIAQAPAAAPQQRREPAPPASPFADASFPPPPFPTHQQQGPRQPFTQPQSHFAPPPPAAAPAPRYAPPPPPLRSFEPAAQKPVPRPVVPPPPPLKPQTPAMPLTSGGETRRIPAVPEMPVPPSVNVQPPVEPIVEYQPEENLDQFEATLEKVAPPSDMPKTEAPKIIAPKIDRFAEEEPDVAKKKRSFVPILVIFIVLVVVCVGGYFGYTAFFQSKSSSTPAVAPITTPTTTPQVPVNPPTPPESTSTKIVDTAAVATPATGKTPESKPVAQPPVAEKKTVAPAPTPKATPVKKAVTARAQTPVRTKPAPVVEPAPSRVVAEPPAPSAVVTDEPAATPPPPPTPKPVVTAPPPPPPPAPEPVAPAPDASAAGGDMSTIFISSNPPLADVYCDGKLVGKTSIKEISVPSGTHTVRLVKGDKELTKQMTFAPGKNPSVFIPIK
jgi:anti-anti-sigma factor